MSKTTLLISAGRTDLKLLANENDRWCTATIGVDSTRAFHDWLLAHPERYIIDHQGSDEIPFYQQPERRLFLSLTIDRTSGELEAEPQGDASDFALAMDQEQRYILVPAKLGRIVAKLQTETQAIDRIIVLNTRRDPESRYGREEPYSAGPVLARWLANVFDLTLSDSQIPKQGQATWVDILRDREDFDRQDGYTNPLIADRLAEILAPIAQDSTQQLILCGIGGIPKIKNLIRDCAYFYFGTRCLLAEDSEQQQHSAAPVVIQPVGRDYLTPEQSFSLRANVAKLICHGDFLGAEAMVHHITDPDHQTWITPIRQIAQLFRGRQISGKAPQTELTRLLSTIGGSKHYCVLPALRLEAALHAQSWIEAIVLTSTFFDAALRDVIELKLTQWGNGHVYDIDEFFVNYRKPSMQFSHRPAPQDPVIPPAFTRAETTKGKNKALMEKKDVRRYVLNITGLETRWLNTLLDTETHDKELASGLAALKGFYGLLNERQVSGKTAKNIRNNCAHLALSPEDLELGIAIFRKFWRIPDSEHDSVETLYFLRQSQVVPVLKALQIPEVGDWYRQLVDLLLKSLRDFRLNPSDASSGK